MEKRRKAAIQYGFALALIVLGLLFNNYSIGVRDFVTFGSVGNWLIFIGVVVMLATTLRAILRKKEVIDERMEFVAAKAMRITFLALVAGAFIIMLIDGIMPITLPYFLFMSYLLCALILIYTITYKVLLGRN